MSLRSTLRLAVRAPRVAAILLGGTLVARIGLWWRGGDPARAYAWKCAMMRWQARAILRACGVRWTVDGKPPAAPFLLVANHLGYMDIVLMCAVTPAWFISKREVADWPGIGWVVRSMNTLFVDRERKADLTRLRPVMDAVLDRGEGIVFYPEGTSGDGSDVLPFKPSLLEAAAARGLPVHWAILHYRTPPGAPSAREAVCWWGDAPFFPHLLGLLRLPAVDARLRFGPAPVAHADRKILAQALRAAVREEFEPIPP
jgi:1-acyl-sn-glycerol-3-phosphate acyltransferase